MILQLSRETVIYISPSYSQPPKEFVTILSGRSCWVISGITPSYFYLPRSHCQQEFYPRQLVFSFFPVFSLAAEPDLNRYLTRIWTSASLSAGPISLTVIWGNEITTDKILKTQVIILNILCGYGKSRPQFPHL